MARRLVTVHPPVHGEGFRAARRRDLGFVRRLAEEVFAPFGDYGTFLSGYVTHPSVTTLILQHRGRRVGFLMLGLVSSSRPLPWEQSEAAVDAAGSGVPGESGAQSVAGEPGRALDVELLAIAVRPTLQSRGFGRKLLQRAIDHAEQWRATAGARSLQLNVADSNSRARTLFRAMGFVEIEPFDGVYPRGQRSIRMARALGGC